MSVRTQVNLSILPERLNQRAGVCEEPIRAVRYIFSDSSEIWTPCAQTTTELPSGVQAWGQLAEPFDRWSISLDPSTTKTTIGTTKLKIQDLNSEFSLAIQAKKQANVGTRKAIVRLYEACKGETFTDAHIVGTYQLYDDSYQAGYITQTLKPLTLTTREKIFETYTLYVASGYSADQNYIDFVDLTESRNEDGSITSLDEKVPLFAHNDYYSSHPYSGDEGAGHNPSTVYSTTTEQARNSTHEKFGYLELTTGEIVVHVGFSINGEDEYGRAIYRANIVERGALGTNATSASIDGDISKTENLSKAKELIYLEEKGPELMSLVLTGYSINGNRVFPWGLDIDRSWLDTAMLAWMNEWPLQKHIVRTSKSVNGKEWLESEIYPVMGAFLNNLPDGRMTAKPLVLPLEDTPSSVEFNHYNCRHIKDRFSFTRKLDEIHSHIITRWGYRETGDYFLFEHNDYYDDSRELYRGTEPLEREFKTLQPGQHTDASISTLSQKLAMANAFERVRMKVKALPSMRYVELGDVVRVNFEKVRDMSSDRPSDVSLNRAMLVTGVDPDAKTRQVVYTLEGYTRKPAPKYPEGTSADNPPVTVDDISNGRQHLSAVMTIESNGDVNGAGTTIPPGEYYYDGPILRFRNTTPFIASQIGRKIGIYCTSTTHVQDDSTSGMFRLSAMGAHPGGYGAVSIGTPARPGESGYFGSGSGGGGADVDIFAINIGNENSPNYSEQFRNVRSQANGATTQGRNGNVSGMSLSRQNGEILGLPADLSGSGGAGGGLTILNGVTDQQTGAQSTVYLRGSTGGRGGMGFELMCGSFAWKAGNQIDLSGGPSADTFQNGQMYGARGADGYPGVFHLILPRHATPPPISEYVLANHGRLESEMQGDRLQSPSEEIRYSVNTDDYRPHYDPQSRTNMAVSCSVVSYIPQDSVPEEFKETFAGREWQADIDSLRADQEALFATTMRSDVDVFFGPTAPNSPKNGDYWGNTSDLVDWGTDGDRVPKGYQFLDNDWELVPVQDSNWKVYVESWLALDAAGKARALADGKIKSYYTESNNRNDWPTPSSYGDLLYVKPRSQMYRAITAGGVLVWDEDDAFVDELAMPTAGQAVIDASFHEIANNNKETWHRTEAYGNTTGTVDYGNYGEGNSPGARIENSDNSTVWFPSVKRYPAKKGDIFRVGGRVKCTNISSSGPAIAIRALDKDGNQIDLKGVQQTSSASEFIDLGQYFDLNSNIVDYSDVNFFDVMFGMTTTATAGSATGYFDHVFVERANYYQNNTVSSSNTSVANTSKVVGSSGNFAIYDTQDTVDIRYSFAFATLDSGKVQIELTETLGQNSRGVIDEATITHPGGFNSENRIVSGQISVDGISPIDLFKFELRAKFVEGNGGTCYSKHVNTRVTRAAQTG